MSLNNPSGGGSGSGVFEGIAALGAAGIQAGSQAAQGRKERQHDVDMANLTLEQNLELADYEYQQQLEMWNRANEYNSPAQQMARLKAAGLNPNLVYGKGAQQNMASELPKYQAPTADFQNVASGVKAGEIGDRLTGGALGLLSQYYQVRSQAQQNDLNEEIIANARNQAGISALKYDELVDRIHGRDGQGVTTRDKEYKYKNNQIKFEQMNEDLIKARGENEIRRIRKAYEDNQLDFQRANQWIKVIQDVMSVFYGGAGAYRDIGMTRRYYD